MDVHKHPEELMTWKEHQVTQELFYKLKARRSEIAEYLCQGGALQEPNIERAVTYYSGIVSAIDDILNLDIFRPQGETEPEEE